MLKPPEPLSPWIAFFQRIKALAETLDECEATETESVEK
jgi:hypothetical protein